MKFFKPDDFKDELPSHFDKLAPIEQYEYMVNIANEKLETSCIEVYSSDIFKEWTHNKKPGRTKKGLIIDFGPIEKCEHPINKIITTYYTPFGRESHWYKCECGAKVKPSTFIEEE